VAICRLGRRRRRSGSNRRLIFRRPILLFRPKRHRTGWRFLHRRRSSCHRFQVLRSLRCRPIHWPDFRLPTFWFSTSMSRWMSSAQRPFQRSCRSARLCQACSSARRPMDCCRRHRHRTFRRPGAVRTRRRRRERSTISRPRSKRSHAPAAGGAVVQVLLGVLTAPGAESEVLDGPRQARAGRRERQHLAGDLELLAGVAIEIDLARLRLEHDLAPTGGVAQAITLARAHRRDFIGAAPG
jgi:hypothetical protein